MMPLKDPEARRAYHRAYMQRRFAEDPAFKQRQVTRIRRNNERYLDESRALIDTFKSAGCAVCAEVDPCCLSAHHLGSWRKDFDIGAALRHRYAPRRVAAELAKCICLCENCHRKVHAGHLILPT